MLDLDELSLEQMKAIPGIGEKAQAEIICRQNTFYGERKTQGNY